MSSILRTAVILSVALGWAGAIGAAAQEVVPPVTSEASMPAAAEQGDAVKAVCPFGGLWRDWQSLGLTWFAVVVILVLTAQTKPLLAWRNLDGLVLAGMCLLLALRAPSAPGGPTQQWWSYLLLTIAAGYWLLRGLHLVFARTVRAGVGNVSPGAMIVLLVAALAVSATQIVRAPLSEGSRDGMIGGAQMVRTGNLPYGDIGEHDRRSPLLYATHAGAVRVTELVTRADLIGDAAAEGAGAREAAARVANLVLWLLTVMGVYVIGRRLHSAEIGLGMAVIFCVFPGAVECLPRPEIMLPAALLTWSLAFALLPAVGGLLATLCLVFAGLAWPWAWLALPVALAYFFRRRWHALGSTVGFLGGAVACVAALTWLTAPTIPRADAALALAGQQLIHAAHVTDDGTVVIDGVESPASGESPWSAPVWRFLIEGDQCTLDNISEATGTTRVEWPNGVDAGSVWYRALNATDEARAALQPHYRAALADAPEGVRVRVALRTVLEATWLPTVAPEPAIEGAWQFWTDGNPEATASAVLIRRVRKAGAGLVALVLVSAFLFGRWRQPYELVGALLAACSAALIASESGAVTNLAWLLPGVLALFAAHGRQRSPKVTPATEPAQCPPLPGLGPAPRISVEN